MNDIALVNSAESTLSQVAPEQSQLSLAGSKELGGVLSRPQLQRSASASQAIASEMLQAWMLGRHSTRQTIGQPSAWRRAR